MYHFCGMALSFIQVAHPNQYLRQAIGERKSAIDTEERCHPPGVLEELLRLREITDL